MMKIPDSLAARFPQIKRELARKLGLNSSSPTEHPPSPRLAEPAFLAGLRAPAFSPPVPKTDDSLWEIVPPAKILFSFDSDSPDAKFALIEIPGNPPRYAFLVNNIDLSAALGEICKELGKADLPVLEPDEHHRMVSAAAELENYSEPVDPVVATLTARVRELEGQNRELQIRTLRYFTLIDTLRMIKRETENLIRIWKSFEPLREECISVLEDANTRRLHHQRLDTEILTISDCLILFRINNNSEETKVLRNHYPKNLLRRTHFDPFINATKDLEHFISVFASEDFQTAVVNPITDTGAPRYSIRNLRELQTEKRTIYKYFPITDMQTYPITTYNYLEDKLISFQRHIQSNMQFLIWEEEPIRSHLRDGNCSQEVNNKEAELFGEIPGQEGILPLIRDFILGPDCIINISKDPISEIRTLKRELKSDLDALGLSQFLGK